MPRRLEIAALVAVAVLLSGCDLGTVATDAGLAAGIGAGAAGIVNNARQIVRANMDTRCSAWFSAKEAWFITQRMTGGKLNAKRFHQIDFENSFYCLHAWQWPGKNADDLVVRNTAEVNSMIEGVAP